MSEFLQILPALIVIGGLMLFPVMVKGMMMFEDWLAKRRDPKNEPND